MFSNPLFFWQKERLKAVLQTNCQTQSLYFRLQTLLPKVPIQDIFLKQPSPLQSMRLLIAEHGPRIEKCHEGKQDIKLGQQIRQCAAFEIEHAHHLIEVRQRIDAGNPLRPHRHTGDRSKETAEQNKNKQEEKRNEHSLLHRGGIVGND